MLEQDRSRDPSQSVDFDRFDRCLSDSFLRDATPPTPRAPLLGLADGLSHSLGTLVEPRDLSSDPTATKHVASLVRPTPSPRPSPLSSPREF